MVTATGEGGWPVGKAEQLRSGNPYRLYLFGIKTPLSLLVGLAQTTSIVDYVASGHLNPLQLVTLGTSVELSYFFMQLPTGVLADLVSRRLCVVLGIALVGAGLAEQGITVSFGNLLVGQFVIGLGAALQEGAIDAWIAGELDEDRMTPIYLRAAQLGLAGGIAGAILSAVLASVSLRLPLLIGGSAVILLGLLLAVVMPEHQAPARAAASGAGPDAPAPTGLASLMRTSRLGFTEQLKDSKTAIVAVPGFVLLLGMIFFTGLWSESFDRLWGDFLLKDFQLPVLFGVRPAGWFSALSVTTALLGLVSTQLAKRRTDDLDGRSTGRTLLALTALVCLGVLAMAGAHGFALAIGTYLFLQALRPVTYPLVTGWIVARVHPGVRATVLSARDMFDSAGQIAGGPLIGWIGVLTTIRTALITGALALLPAIGLLSAAIARMRPVATENDDEAPEAVPIGS